jgi:hypothetical protein
MTWGSEIEAMIKQVRETPPEERTECPIDSWSLERTQDGTLHCPFCGWTDGLGKRIG